MKEMETKKIESKRLAYHPLDTSFLSSDYVSWMNDEEVNRYLESGGDYSLQKLEDFLKGVEKREILFWAIVIKENGKHIGNIKIDPISKRNKTGEYGILIGDKTAWGQGYAKEATQTILDFCFSDKVGLRKVTLGVVADNTAALRLYQKLGFGEEGLYKQHAYHDGKWCDIVRMAIFNSSLENDY